MADETKEQIIETIKSIEKAIADECVSQGEIHYLQTHKEDVLAYDIENGTNTLSQWADISEDEFNRGEINTPTTTEAVEVTIKFTVNKEQYKDYERELDDFIANLYNNDIINEYPEVTENDINE